MLVVWRDIARAIVTSILGKKKKEIDLRVTKLKKYLSVITQLVCGDMRHPGLEPGPTAWKADTLPLDQ